MLLTLYLATLGSNSAACGANVSNKEMEVVWTLVVLVSIFFSHFLIYLLRVNPIT